MQKMRVGVLMGGKSQEREVSFNSGRTICDHLDTNRYEIIPLFQTRKGELFILPWHFLHRGKTNDFVHRLPTEATKIGWDDLKELVDFIYLAMHGKYAEDGTVQGFLEILGIPYLGSKIFASSLGMDKIMQKEVLQSHNIAVAKGIAVYPYQIRKFEKYKQHIFDRLDKAKIKPPYIVKPNQEGSSLGVEMVPTKKTLDKALKRASAVTPGHEQPVLIEEKIEGKEISCCLITDTKTGKPIPLIPTEITLESGTHLFDYEQKYMPGKGHEHTPARCSNDIMQKIQKICTRVMEILDITNMARIDGFLTENNEFVVIDPNTITGMAPSSFFFREAAELNINHTQLINHLIETELRYYGLLEPIIEQEKKQEKSMQGKKINVAILLGGNTNEKEISLESGRNITYKLSPKKYNAIPIFVSRNMELYKLTNRELVRNSTKEIEELLLPQDKLRWDDLSEIADFVFIALHGGQGENGAVQGTLQMLGLPYNGSGVLASALCANKSKTNELLKTKGFDVPQSLLLSHQEWECNKDTWLEEIEKKLSFPFILKPHNDGCSVLVEKIKDKRDLIKKLTIFFRSKKTAMLEELVQGMELTVGVIGNHNPQALPPSQTVASDEILTIEEKFLPGAGENQTPAPLSKNSLAFVQEINKKVYTILGCKGYARIDCFWQSAQTSPTGKERVIILEVNTLPGMTPATCIFHQAAEVGIKPMDFIDLIVGLGLQEHRNSEPESLLFKQSIERKILQKA